VKKSLAGGDAALKEYDALTANADDRADSKGAPGQKA
jgi:hypothetical protein